MVPHLNLDDGLVAFLFPADEGIRRQRELMPVEFEGLVRQWNGVQLGELLKHGVDAFVALFRGLRLGAKHNSHRLLLLLVARFGKSADEPPGRGTLKGANPRMPSAGAFTARGDFGGRGVGAGLAYGFGSNVLGRRPLLVPQPVFLGGMFASLFKLARGARGTIS